MKVAYLFESEHAREILENMIIPQLEEDLSRSRGCRNDVLLR